MKDGRFGRSALGVAGKGISSLSPCVLIHMASEAPHGGVIKVQGGCELHRIIAGPHPNSESLFLVIHTYENSFNSHNTAMQQALLLVLPPHKQDH